MALKTQAPWLFLPCSSCVALIPAAGEARALPISPPIPLPPFLALAPGMLSLLTAGICISLSKGFPKAAAACSAGAQGEPEVPGNGCPPTPELLAVD